MSIKVNNVYRFTYRLGCLAVDRSEPTNRQRLDGADVLVVSLPDDIRAEVEALDGTVFRIWRDELTDVASTPADRFAGYIEPTVDRTASETLTRDIDVAESVVQQVRDSVERTSHPALSGELRHAQGFAEGVAAYARLVRDGEATDELAKLLDR